MQKLKKQTPYGYIVIAIAAVVGFVLLNYDRSNPESRPAESAHLGLPEQDTPDPELLSDNTAQLTVDTPLAIHDDPAKREATKELVTPIYETDRDFRDAALAEAERFVADNFGYDRGILRWEAIRIDADELIIGDFLKQDALSKEFTVSIFSDISYKATETEYSPQVPNNMAVWKGVLDDGESGTIKISIIKGDERTSFIVRMHGPDGHFLIVETELPNVYVAAQADPTWQRGAAVD